MSVKRKVTVPVGNSAIPAYLKVSGTSRCDCSTRRKTVETIRMPRLNLFGCVEMTCLMAGRAGVIELLERSQVLIH